MYAYNCIYVVRNSFLKMKTNLSLRFKHNFSLHQFQDATLPKLPVPTLEHTMECYLETMKPILKPAQHDKLRQIIENFAGPGGLGPKLQLYLENRREKLDNWVIFLFFMSYKI